MMFLENRLVYHPVPYPVGGWQPAGLSFEDAQFAADDGTALHGWYIEHPRDTPTLEESDFFSNPDAAAVHLVRRLGLA